MKAKKLAAAGAFFVLASAFSFAASWAECWKNYGGGIQEHNVIWNIGVGLLSDSVYYNNHRYVVPHLETTVEFTQKIGVLPFGFGGFFGFNGWGDSWNKGRDTYDAQNFYFGGLVNYHLGFPPERLDFYAGLRLGVRVHSWQRRYSDNTEDMLRSYAHGYWSGHIGTSWYFTKIFGLNAELGYPTILKLSASFKFN
ncbi:MAG: hypothetical protein ACTTKL_09625 [Treponema sp.]